MADCVSNDKVSHLPIPICNEEIWPRPKKFLIANGKWPGEGPLVQTSGITAPRLSSPISTLADRVGCSGPHAASIRPPVGRNRGRLQNPAKARLLFLLSGFLEERAAPENKETQTWHLRQAPISTV